jgi:hypothetical protein
MKQLRLYGMYRAFDSSLSPQSINYTNDELIAYLLQSEWDDRQNRKIERLTKAMRICDVFHPNLPLSHSETPKIIFLFL